MILNKKRFFRIKKEVMSFESSDWYRVSIVNLSAFFFNIAIFHQ